MTLCEQRMKLLLDTCVSSSEAGGFIVENLTQRRSGAEKMRIGRGMGVLKS